MRWTPVFEGQTPFYNEGSFSCPSASIPPCAQCSKAAEKSLRAHLAQGPRMDCDCRQTKTVIDPCFKPKSCECYCLGIGMLEESCPYEIKQKRR